MGLDRAFCPQRLFNEGWDAIAVLARQCLARTAIASQPSLKRRCGQKARSSPISAWLAQTHRSVTCRFPPDPRSCCYQAQVIETPENLSSPMNSVWIDLTCASMWRSDAGTTPAPEHPSPEPRVKSLSIGSLTGWATSGSPNPCTDRPTHAATLMNPPGRCVA